MQSVRFARLRRVALAGAVLAPLAVCALPVQAQLQPGYVVTGRNATNTADAFTHVDIGVAYEVGTAGAPGSWDLHVHFDPPLPGFPISPTTGEAGEYAPDEALFYLSQDTATPLSDPFAPLGTTGAQTVYLVPQDFPTDPISWVGIGAEENVPSDFNGGVQLYLRGLRHTTLDGLAGTGNFAVFRNAALGGTLTVQMSSAQGGITDDDVINVAVGGHDHFNFAFSEAGFYEVDFEATGTPRDGGPTSSGVQTYYFGVLTTTQPGVSAAAPEPGSLALLGIVGVWGLGRRARRLRRKAS